MHKAFLIKKKKERKKKEPQVYLKIAVKKLILYKEIAAQNG